MGVAERKERQRAEVRELILDAARSIVDSEGMQALTIRRIASAIEYAPGTIYVYFENRDEIARQLVRDGFAELVSYMAPAAQSRDPWERLAAIGRAYARFGVERPQTYRTIFLQPPEIAQALMDMVKPEGEVDDGDRAFTILASTVDELIRAGTFRKELDALVTAETIWSWLHGLLALRIMCRQAMITDFDASVDLIIDGIRKAFA